MSNWTKSGSFSTNRGKAPRLEELIDLVKLKPKKFTYLRPIGPAHFYAEYWIEIKTNSGKFIKIRKISPTFNSKTMDFDTPCPYMEKCGAQPRIIALINAIDRKEQKNEPRRKSKPTKEEREVHKIDGGKYRFKSKDSETWSPVGAYRITSSAGGKIQDIAAINRKKNKKTGNVEAFGPEDAVNGFDLAIKFDPDRAPAEQYSVQKHENTKLTDEEKEYHIQNIWAEKPEKLADAIKEAESLASRMVVRDSDGEIVETKKSSKGKGTSKPDYLSDLDDEDVEDDEPKKKKKSKDADSSKKKKKKKSRFDL